MNRLFASKTFRIAFPSVFLVALSVWASIGFYYPGTFRKEANTGHRLGGDVFTDLPENSLAVFRKAIAEIERNEDYLYSECDLRETLDHHIVIFHDWDLKRLVPDCVENRLALDEPQIGQQRIRDLTLAQIKSLELENGHPIPSLEELLETAIELNLKKPLILEIKYFHSERGRQAVIDLAKKYRDHSQLEIHFSAFRRNLGRSCPTPKNWLNQFQSAGFRVYQVYRPKTSQYDLCETW